MARIIVASILLFLTGCAGGVDYTTEPAPVMTQGTVCVTPDARDYWAGTTAVDGPCDQLGIDLFVFVGQDMTGTDVVTDTSVDGCSTAVRAPAFEMHVVWNPSHTDAAGSYQTPNGCLYTVELQEAVSK
jgi:hypothetical protein